MPDRITHPITISPVNNTSFAFLFPLIALKISYASLLHPAPLRETFIKKSFVVQLNNFPVLFNSKIIYTWIGMSYWTRFRR
ncbi:hypothetical protein J2T02_005125 [Chitinophaga terrae (ex Kim and Jung 2007)]|nr:hypothetical protein [Chitinophaga terrae (ex Kim and Jung 2007)]